MKSKTMNKLIEEQLKKVNYAELINFNPQTNTYFIPKKKDIRVIVDNCYLIKLKPSFRTNEVVKVNWNNNQLPLYDMLEIDVQKIMGKMIKVNCIGYNEKENAPLNYFWSGWLYIPDIEIIKQL